MTGKLESEFSNSKYSGEDSVKVYKIYDKNGIKLDQKRFPSVAKAKKHIENKFGNGEYMIEEMSLREEAKLFKAFIK